MSAPHVQILDLPRTGKTLRWRDPESGKVKQSNARRLGLTTDAKLRRFVDELSEHLAFCKRAKLLGLTLPKTEQESAPQAPSRPTGEVINDYLDRFEHRATLQGNKTALALFQRLIKEPLHDLTSEHVVRLRDRIAQQGYKRSTVKQRRTQLATFLRWCADRGEVTNVSDRAIATLAKADRTKEAKEVRVLTPDQLRAVRRWFAENAPADLCAFLDVQVLTGCRVDEVQQLHKDWVQVDRLRIPAHATKTRTRRDVVFSVSPTLGPLLESLDGEQPFKGRAKSYGRYLRNAERALGITIGGTHTIRRTTATALWCAGLLPPLQAAARLGHSVQVAESSYATVLTADQLGKGSTIEQVLGL